MKTALVKNFTAWVSHVWSQCQKVRKGTIFIHQLRPIRFRRRVGSDGPHRYCVFPAPRQHAEMSRSACVNWWKTQCCWSHFLQIYSLLWPKRQPILKKKLLHDSNKKICIWSLDWKSSLYQKKKIKKILYNLIKNNTVVASCFFFYRVNTNNLLALKRAFFITAWLLRAGLRWDTDLDSTKGPGWWNPFVRTLGITAGMLWFCADEQQRLFSFLRSCVSGPASNLGPEAWGSAWSGGLWRGIQNCSALPYSQPALDQVYKKHMWALKASPQTPCMSRELPGTGYCNWFQSQALALHLENKKKSRKLQRRHFDCKPKVQFWFFFFPEFTHSWCIKMVKQSLCAALLPLKVLSLSCPNHNNCKVHHRVYMLTYTQNLKDLHKNRKSAQTAQFFPKSHWIPHICTFMDKVYIRQTLGLSTGWQEELKKKVNGHKKHNNPHTHRCTKTHEHSLGWEIDNTGMYFFFYYK